MHPCSVIALCLAAGVLAPTADAASSTQTVSLRASARHVWGGQTTQEVSIAVGPGNGATPASVYLLRQTGVSRGLARRTADTLTDVAGWPMPRLMRARSTGFAFERSFVAASRDGRVAVADPGSLALTVVDGRSGRRIWRRQLDRLGLPSSPAVGDIAYDGTANGRLYVWDGVHRGALRFSSSGRYLGLVKFTTDAPVLRMDVRGSRVALITASRPGAPRTVLLGGVGGGRPRVLTLAGGNGHTAVDVDLDGARRPYLMIRTRQGGTDLYTLEPGTGFAIDQATVPVAPGLEFTPAPRFLDLGDDDTPTISDALGVTRYAVTP